MLSTKNKVLFSLINQSALCTIAVHIFANGIHQMLITGEFLQREFFSRRSVRLTYEEDPVGYILCIIAFALFIVGFSLFAFFAWRDLLTGNREIASGYAISDIAREKSWVEKTWYIGPALLALFAFASMSEHW